MTREWRRNWIVLTAIVVHTMWAVLLLFSDAPLHTTPLADFPTKDRLAASAAYFAASAMAAVPIVWPSLDRTFLGLSLTLPQQYLLMISAFTGIMCGLRGQYPDGYVPEGGVYFIWADQLWAVVGMIAHTASLVDWYHYARLSKGGSPWNG